MHLANTEIYIHMATKGCLKCESFYVVSLFSFVEMHVQYIRRLLVQLAEFVLYEFLHL